MINSTENPQLNDDDVLQAFKILALRVAGDTFVAADCRTTLANWLVHEANAANITTRVATALLGELFESGAIIATTRGQSGFVFDVERMSQSRYGVIAADEHKRHLEPLGWVNEVIRNRA